jgi:hypothetical protein
MTAVLDAPETHPEKVKRRALNVREHPDDR